MTEIKTSRRWGFYPILDQEAFKFYISQQKALWNPSDVNFSHDYTNFCQLTKDEQIPLIRALTIFQTLDGGVIDRFVLGLINRAEALEDRLAYIVQLYTEVVHANSYGLQLIHLIPNDFERQSYLEAIDSEPWLQRYRDFIDKYTDDSVPEIIAVASQSALEGVGFSGLFAIIFWYRTSIYARDIPGITTSNEYIAAEEGIHRNYAVFRFLRLREKCDPEEIKTKVIAIFSELMDIIKEALPILLPTDLRGLSKQELYDYSCYVMDMLYEDMGYPKVYNVKNPLIYMNRIGGSQKTSTFEHQSTDYSKGDLFRDDDGDF